VNLIKKNKNKSRKIGTFHLAMITVAFVASIRMLPMMAEFGLGLIILYGLAAVSFLFPAALVSAELASTFPSRGGIYTWVKKALPGPWGFIAIWLQIVAVITMMPAYLSFDAATFAYSFSSGLANNKYFLVLFILVVYWTIILVSVLGMKTAGWLNTIGAFIGVFIPIVLIIVLGSVWFIRGEATNVVISSKSLLPNFSFTNLLFLAGLLFSLTGMESSGSHALDVKNVQKNYPKAMIISAVIILFIGLGAVAIAMVIPKEQISVVSGLMQAFEVFLDKFNMKWFVPILALMIACGSIVTINSLIIGPSKGVLGTARHGDIPPILAKQNRFGMPANLLFFQAIIVSIYSLIFIFMPNPDSTYCLLTAVLSVSYMVMYILFFVSVVVLRYTKPNINRPFKIPGGKIGLWITAVLGTLSAVLGIIVSFFPPTQMHNKNYLRYEGILIKRGFNSPMLCIEKTELFRF
jgi:glutamate:GABA antiporter